jgi:choline-sulfatase
METLLLAEMRRLNDPWRLWNQPDDGLPPAAETQPRVRNKDKKKPKSK